jgi:predicted RNA-binding protein with PIN domain
MPRYEGGDKSRSCNGVYITRKSCPVPACAKPLRRRQGQGASLSRMHLIIDGYNLLHITFPLFQGASEDLQRNRDQLIDQLSSYRQKKPFEITVVFDGWRGGWVTEKRERNKGIDLIFSKLGETADEVIKRLVKERGSGAVVVTSDRDISRYAQRMSVAVIPSDQFRERIGQSGLRNEEKDALEEEETESSKKGPSRTLSKKEKRLRAALKKL